MDPLHVLLLFGGGLLAGFINVLAGGGSVITLPILILTGLPANVANATNRIGVLFQTGTASYGLSRHGLLPLRQALQLGVFGLAGALCGAIIAVELNEQLLDRIIGALLLLVGIYIVWPRKGKAGFTVESAAASRSPWVYPVIFAIGIYGGFIQAGTGFLIIAALQYFRPMEIMRINAIKAAIVCLYTLPVLLLFLANDLVRWPEGISLAAGTSSGAWLASKYADRFSERWVRWVILGMVLLSSLKLFWKTSF